jgi:hypothetical protein
MAIEDTMRGARHVETKRSDDALDPARTDQPEPGGTSLVRTSAGNLPSVDDLRPVTRLPQGVPTPLTRQADPAGRGGIRIPRRACR